MRAGKSGRGRRSRMMVSVVVLGLVGSLLPIAAEGEAAGGGLVEEAAEPGEAVDATSVPPPESPPAPARELAVSDGDFSNPPPLGEGGSESPQESGAAQEGFNPDRSARVDELTTSVREVFENPDGSRTAVLSAAPVRFRDQAGVWRDYDLDAVARDGRFEAERSDLGVAVPADPARGLAVVETASGTLRFGVPSVMPAPARPSRNGPVLTHAGPSGLRSEVVLTTGGFEQRLVLPASAARTPAYRMVLALPEGAAVHQVPGGVEVVGAGGEALGRFVGGVAWDAGGSDTEVLVRLVSQSGTQATVEVSVDRGWMASGDRTFPITIDPTWTSTTEDTGALDTFVRETWSTPQSSTGWVVAGRADDGDRRRALLRFDLPSDLPYDAVTVSESHLRLYANNAGDCTADRYWIHGLASGFNANTVWSNMPGTDSYGLVSETLMAKGTGGCPADLVDLDTTALAQRWFDGTEANHGLQVRAKYETSAAHWQQWASAEAAAAAPKLYVTYNRAPGVPELSSPAADATVLTTTPTLTAQPVTDADGDPVSYWFRAWTEDSPEPQGQIFDSGWIPSSSACSGTPQVCTWTPPEGALADGVTYSWAVWATDGVTSPLPPTSHRRFSVDTHRSAGSDQVGPVTVDLTSGRAAVSVSGPSFGTVGGGIGVSMSYESQAPATRGLTGYYYNDANIPLVFDDALVVSRPDSQVNFDWGEDIPYPGVDSDRFLVRWAGTVTAPTSGQYWFGASHDAGARIDVAGGSDELDRWYSSSSSVEYGSSISLTAGVPVPITVEMWEGTGNSELALYVKGAVSEQVVPPSWLTPESQPDTVLPDGWGLSLPATGGFTYNRATVTDDAVTFHGEWGITTEFTRTENDGWEPTDPADTSTLALDEAGMLTLQGADGFTYVFNPDGTLASVTSALDTDNPAALGYTWQTVSAGDHTYPRLTTITDPVSGREVELAYNDGASCQTSPATPAGMLCRVEYWDSTMTQLSYDASGNLARITNPGGEVTDFWYVDGLLTEIRDPLGADAVAEGVRGSGSDDEATRTRIVYDTNPDPTRRRVTAVRQPAPTAGAARPEHTYTYNAGSTDVSVVGLPNGYWRRVTFDAEGRILTERDALARATTYIWDAAGDRIVAVDDPAGLRITTVLDGRQLPVDSYGPAPAAWFNADGTPQSAYAAQVPRRHTGFDEGLNSLAATWWDGTDMAGPETTRDTGVGHSSGDIDRDWGSGAPPGISDGDFSGRLSGEIIFPSAGTYELKLYREGKVRLYLDWDQRIDSWTEATGNTSPTTFVATAGQRVPIMIEYANTDGNNQNLDAALQLLWKPPGAGSFSVVPGAQLDPAYRLVTSESDPDGNVTAPGYVSPEEPLPISETSDPGGLALTTSTDYEPPGSGYRRAVSRTLPAGNEWTYSYYGDAETADNPCTQGSDPANQGGALRTRTGPSPASGSAITTETVYDIAGRPVATRVGTEAWSCVTYDARGRPTQRSVPAFGGEPARTITWNHAVGGNPLVTSVTDSAGTITTTVDLLGRTTEIVDVWGKTTTFAYDQPGRLTSRTGPEGTQVWEYDATGQPTAQSLDGAVVATVTYDSVSGRPSSYAYPSEGTGHGGNGTYTDTLVYDDLGRPSGLTWRQAGGALLSSDQHTYTLAGRLADQTIDGSDANAGDNFTYDAAGRLTGAHVPGHAITYGFAPTGGCGASPSAGANTNRTSQVDNATSTTYCYDHADRLTRYTVEGQGATTLAYDAHGNTTAAGSETYGFDADDRHATTTAGATTVRYTRDATDRVVERTENGVVTARYSFGAVLDTSGAVVERTIPLPGGVILTKRAGGDVWSYPNLRGEVVATADASGAKVGPTRHYSPFGESYQVLPDNARDDYDLAWTGQRFTEHAPGLTDTIEMGARLYSPQLGRFLEVDPVEGGSANDYEYAAGDPCNHLDYSGRATCPTMNIVSRRAPSGRLRYWVKFFGGSPAIWYGVVVWAADPLGSWGGRTVYDFYVSSGQLFFRRSWISHERDLGIVPQSIRFYLEMAIVVVSWGWWPPWDIGWNTEECNYSFIGAG